MAKRQEKIIELDHSEYEDDFFETELYADYDILIKRIETSKKQSKVKSKKFARNRLNDYFERKALKQKLDQWDNYFDH